MSHEIETMAYAGQVPWHGIGNRVDPTVSVEEMLKAAGLDWQVNLKPCYAYDAETDRAIPISRQALIRDKDNKVLTVTGDNWHPLQNADALGFFRDFTEAGGATLETAGSLRGGKVVWGLASLNEQFTVGTSEDVVKGYLLLISPHEVGKSIRGFTTTVRVVCANTMRMAEMGEGNAQASFRQDHLKEFNFEAAKDMLNVCRLQLGTAKMEAEALAQLRVSEFEGARLLARYFQPGAGDLAKKDKKAYNKFVEQLLENTDLQSKALGGVIHSVNNAPGAQPETGWGILNGVTHWCDHVAGREADARMFNSWLGDRSRTKLRVNRDLVEMAKAA